jgi:hypothetical protein
MRIGNRNSKNVEKTCPRIILTAINSTWFDQGLNPGHCGE